MIKNEKTNWNSHGLNQSTGNLQNIKEILGGVIKPIPNSISLHKLKRHQSKIELNIRNLISDIKKKAPITRKLSNAKSENFVAIPLAPRLKFAVTEPKSLTKINLSQTISKPNTKKLKKLPLEIKRKISVKNESIYDYVNSNNRFEEFVKKLGHTDVKADFDYKESEAHRVSSFFNTFVYNSNTKVPKITKKSEKQIDIEIDKAKNVAQYLDRVVKEFKLEDVDESRFKDEINIFDAYLGKD